ncbi:hypothetical protein NQ315_011556 [Exocentrus adspersus]|uniref:Peptidase S1 domain-containing protein n=1 Tax=Exocentrus adspersus TaxID=1586481 RepID=A0AAV8VV49_9CUCU|nr:hypothetical protein NQ315_011556 [Exocentrus adspersus]
MRTAILLIASLSCCFALPPSSSIDWSKVRAKNAYVEPVSNASLPVNPRIIGGREVTPNSRPFQVALVIDGGHFCGGSLISRSYILTAAHCIEGHAYFQIILGAHNIRESESTQIVLTSTSSTVHPGYNPVTFNNDVGLIRLPNPITLNNNIQTVALAPASSGSFVDARATLTGWGRLSDSSNTVSSTLHIVDLTVMANFWCARNYGSEVVIASTICTSGVSTSGSVGGCDGDSGGPLVIEGVQAGIASFVAYTGCQNGLPTGYARITSFRSWIVENSDVE